MSREYEAGDIVDIVVDKYCNAILTATSSKPTLVSELVDEFGMSSATAYRRLHRLCDYGLLKERTRIDNAGNQVHVYEARFRSIKWEICNGIAYVHIIWDDDHDIVRLWNRR